MANEAWLNGKLDGFAPVLMPAAHALAQAVTDLRGLAANLSDDEINGRPSGAPSAAFHLRHIAGSIDRLLTYTRGEQLGEAQFEFLRVENSDDANAEVADLIESAVVAINRALEVLKTVSPEILFEPRTVGREKLPTNVFGLLFHIAEHTARHVGQTVTTVAIVRGGKNNLTN